MATTQRNRRDEIMRYLEGMLRAPLREARRSHSRYGWDIIAENGNTTFLEHVYMLEIMPMANESRYDVIRFPPKYDPRAMAMYQPQYLYGVDEARYMSQDDYVMAMRYGSMRDPERNGVSPTKKEVKKDKRTENVRKLFWHRYVQTGVKPFK